MEYVYFRDKLSKIVQLKSIFHQVHTSLSRKTLAFFEKMEINAEKGYVKFGDNNSNFDDKETLFVLPPKYKRFDNFTENRKYCTKTLVALSINVMVVAGLATGLLILGLKNVELENRIESLQQNFSNAQNLSQSQIDAFEQDLASKNKTITFLENLIDKYQYLNVHSEIEHDQALRELHANYTKAKNLTQIEMENLKKVNEKLMDDFNKSNSFLKNLIDSHDEKGFTELHKATGRNDTEEVKILLKWGADPDIKDIDENGTALDWAAFHGFPEIVAILLKNGANKNLTNWHNRTPLEEAKYHKNGDYEKVIALLTEN